MSLDFDIEAELERNEAKEITEESLNGGLIYFVSRVLEGLNAPILAPARRVSNLFERAIQSRTVAISEPIPEGVYYGNPTMEFLMALPDEYYGRRVELATRYGFNVPFSLARAGGKLYIRLHMPEDEFVQLSKKTG